MNSFLHRPHPALLVSVRNSAEAIEALAGGADVIDIKEPNKGPLGAAESETICDVIQTVGCRAPVTAAFGELTEIVARAVPSQPWSTPRGLALFKIGLAGCNELPDWRSTWQQAVTELSHGEPAARPVAVAYADWRLARAPHPDEVLALACANKCPALLIDTWDKSSGNLFDHWPAAHLQTFMDRVRTHHIAVVLAGSLTGSAFELAHKLQPNLVAVRTAACEGGRNSNVRADRVRTLKFAAAAVLRIEDQITSENEPRLAPYG
jgi:uncharacterized protein (UPF0264 family)